jgi:hypothetical protein
VEISETAGVAIQASEFFIGGPVDIITKNFWTLSIKNLANKLRIYVVSDLTVYIYTHKTALDVQTAKIPSENSSLQSRCVDKYPASQTN